MIIDGFQKMTLLDFPGRIGCIVFTRGCNFRCSFCQNSPLISCSQNQGMIQESAIFQYLEKRKNILDGVVVSGGEPLIQKGIVEFIQKIKAMGYQVKLDTNGSNPNILRNLIDQHLIDYVAMDVKNVFPKYFKTIGGNTMLQNVEKSIEMIKQSGIPHEFRTTIVKELHTKEDMYQICEYLGKDANYYLQNFQDSENVIDHRLHGFSLDELKNIHQFLKKDFPNIHVRALN